MMWASGGYIKPGREAEGLPVQGEYVLPKQTLERVSAAFERLADATTGVSIQIRQLHKPRLFHKIDWYFSRDFLRQQGWEFMLRVDPRRWEARVGELTPARLHLTIHFFPFWVRVRTHHFEEE